MDPAHVAEGDDQRPAGMTAMEEEMPDEGSRAPNLPATKGVEQSVDAQGGAPVETKEAAVETPAPNTGSKGQQEQRDAEQVHHGHSDTLTGSNTSKCLPVVRLPIWRPAGQAPQRHPRSSTSAPAASHSERTKAVSPRRPSTSEEARRKPLHRKAFGSSSDRGLAPLRCTSRPRSRTPADVSEKLATSTTPRANHDSERPWRQERDVTPRLKWRSGRLLHSSRARRASFCTCGPSHHATRWNPTC